MRPRSYASFPFAASALALFGCDSNQPLGPAAETEARLPIALAAAGVSAPSNTNAVASSETEIDISWQDNSGNESKFEVHRSGTLTGSFTLLATTGPQITRYSDQGLEPGSQHCYKVRAARVNGRNTSYSAFSNTACATTPVPPPPAPAAASGTTAKPWNSSWVLVSWIDNSSNEDGFHIDRSLDGGGTWELSPTVAASYTSAYVPALAEQQACYRVVAFNAGGKGPPSNTVCATPPAGPTNMVVTRLDTIVELTWSDNSAVEDGYQVWLFQTNCLGPACPGFDPGCEYGYYTCGEELILIAGLPANSAAYTGPNPGSAGYPYNVIYVVATKDGGISDSSVPGFPR